MLGEMPVIMQKFLTQTIRMLQTVTMLLLSNVHWARVVWARRILLAMVPVAGHEMKIVLCLITSITTTYGTVICNRFLLPFSRYNYG